MTLATNIYITTTTATPKQVFSAMQHFLARFDEYGRTPQEHITDHGESWSPEGADPRLPGRTRYANRLGQDLPAILHVEYRPGGHDFCTTEEAETHSPYCNFPESPDYDPDKETCPGGAEAEDHETACVMKVWLDTAYGYRGPTLITEDGTHTMNCTDLHAALIAELGQWLETEHAGAWKWRNEYTGEIHTRYDGLAEFTGLGVKQQDWWLNFAKPAIEQHMKEIEAE